MKKHHALGRGSFILFLAILVVSIFSGIALTMVSKKPMPQPSPTPQQAVHQVSDLPFKTAPFENGYPVGETVVYLDDLENKFAQRFESSERTKSSFTNWVQAAEYVTEDAILQSEGVRDNLFENPEDRRLSEEMITRARIYYDTQGISHISGEAITIWFMNQKLPQMPLTQARELAQTLLADYRGKVMTGELTMRQAGDAIAATTELAKLDEQYQSNAYFLFRAKQGEAVMLDPVLNTRVLSMDSGEISDVLVGRSKGADAYTIESYYTVIKVNEKVVKGYASREELVNKRKQEGITIQLERL